MLIIVLINLLVLLNCFLERKEVESALCGALAEEEMVEIGIQILTIKLLLVISIVFGFFWDTLYSTKECLT
jgi:hypothetical protein